MGGDRVLKSDNDLSRTELECEGGVPEGPSRGRSHGRQRNRIQTGDDSLGALVFWQTMQVREGQAVVPWRPVSRGQRAVTRGWSVVSLGFHSRTAAREARDQGKSQNLSLPAALTL